MHMQAWLQCHDQRELRGDGATHEHDPDDTMVVSTTQSCNISVLVHIKCYVLLVYRAKIKISLYLPF